MENKHRQNLQCRSVVKLISADLIGTMRGLQGHLHHCPNCTAYLDSLEKTIALFGRYDSPMPSRTRRAFHRSLASRGVAL